MGGVAVVVLASTFGKKATPAWCSAWVEGAKGNIAATGRAGRFNNSLAGPYIVNIVGGIKGATNNLVLVGVNVTGIH